MSSASSTTDVIESRGGDEGKGVDVPLMLYFLFWYVGNYMYNISNKLALTAAGGASGFPMAISWHQIQSGSQ